MAAGAGTSAAAATAAAAAVRFTPLLGVHGRGPLAYLLELDGFTFLLDCGWNDAYDPALLAPLVAALPRIDAVLLSHSDPCHLGALPYLVGRCGLAAPVYATSPVHKMGQMALYDQYLSRQACSDFDTFNLDDVDAAFALVQPLRYQQNLALSGKGAGILITPFAAGHLLGGSVWRIRKNGEDYVYAPDYNHRKERHLNGTVLEAAFQRPALLITGSLNALQVAPDRPNREKELLDAVMGTLRGDGSVLLPIDTAGRLLELVLLLERHWVEHRLTYPLVLLSAMAYSTLEFAKSQLEWMCEALVKNLGHARDNPFATRFLKLCGSREELAHLPRGPKLVLATLPSLESGFSRQLFADWAEEPRNAIIFVTRAEEGTLAEQVQQLGAQQAQQAQQGEAPTLRMLRSHRVPLEGEELEAHLAQQTQQAEQAAQQAQQDADARQQQAAAEAQGPQAMQVDGGPEAAAAAAVAAVDGGTFSPRASAVPRVNSLAIGHLKSFRAGLSGPGSPTALRGEVVGPDGIPVQEYQEAASTAQCLVEGFEVPKGAARPMFPFEDEWEHVAHDEYGASLDYADFDPAEAIGFKALESELQAEAEAEDAGAPPDIPTKVVSATITVTLRARVVRFDFDGLSDGRSMRTILAHVAPRQCILVHGSSEATAALSGHLRQELAGLLTQVYEPQAGEEIELRAEPSYRLALSDELVAGIRLHRIGDYKLGWVEGRVGPPAEGSESQLPQLLPAERADAGAADGGYGGVFIGDVRLSELKQALAAAGIPSEFYAGALYCAGQVVIKRRQPGSGEEPGGDGGLVLEGALSPDYYKIREACYHGCAFDASAASRRPHRSARWRQFSSTAADSGGSSSTAVLSNTSTFLRNLSNGAEIFLVGTAHVSKQSAQEVRDMIRLVKPSSVMVELCAQRAARLRAGPEHEADYLQQMLKQIMFGGGTFSQKMVQVSLPMMYKMMKMMGMEPGGEFKVALEEADACGARVVYGDRDVQATLQRLSQNMDLQQLLQIATGRGLPEPPASLVEAFRSSGGEGLKGQVEGMKNRRLVRDMCEYMRTVNPGLAKALIDERDDIMTRSLLRLEGRVVGVVGLAHLDGIERRWEEAQVGRALTAG